jgi:hypothetical protein
MMRFLSKVWSIIKAITEGLGSNTRLSKRLVGYLQVLLFCYFFFTFSYSSWTGNKKLTFLDESYLIKGSTMFMILPMLIILFLEFLNLYFAVTETKERKEIRYTDEQKLLNVKRKYLDAILEQLKLDVDKDLKKYLENGEIDRANEAIKDKIDALNALVDTVKGDNSKVLRGTEISSIDSFYDSTNSRVRGEIRRITYNSSVNMLIGVVASVAAVWLLVSTIQEHKVELMEIVPRATVSLLIEAFAFFFFSQYRKQQEEIKYWNNEKTNLDLKIFAFSIALEDSEIGTKEYMQNLINALIQTDRNIFSGDVAKVEEKKNVDGGGVADDVLKKVKEVGELLEKSKGLVGGK